MAKNVSIAQEAPNKVTPPIVDSLISISKTVRALVALRLAEIGLYVGQDELLILLSQSAEMKLTDLAERACVRVSTASKSVDRLAEKGYVCRSVDPHDARVSRIHITPAGTAIAIEVTKLRASLGDELMAHFREPVAATLDRIDGLLREKLSKSRF